MKTVLGPTFLPLDQGALHAAQFGIDLSFVAQYRFQYHEFRKCEGSERCFECELSVYLCAASVDGAGPEASYSNQSLIISSRHSLPEYPLDECVRVFFRFWHLLDVCTNLVVHVTQIDSQSEEDSTKWQTGIKSRCTIVSPFPVAQD